MSPMSGRRVASLGDPRAGTLTARRLGGHSRSPWAAGLPRISATEECKILVFRP